MTLFQQRNWNNLIFPELFEDQYKENSPQNYQKINWELNQGNILQVYQKMYQELFKEFELYKEPYDECSYQQYQSQNSGDNLYSTLWKMAEDLLNNYGSMMEMVGYFDDLDDEYVFYINS